ncbi:hypothetical protein Mal33_38960 [Rosistilla oblonga]|uniref:Uncharacterized protein n=1 Tax=Rosistilla oblonga TaxID=2527990 RepID=A0A518IXR4_9BACT|nr:hypothetical protein Mal33_38960 [Rosistilla oblonga]
MPAQGNALGLGSNTNDGGPTPRSRHVTATRRCVWAAVRVGGGACGRRYVWAAVRVSGGTCERRYASAAVRVDAVGVAAAVKRLRPTSFLFDRPNGAGGTSAQGNALGLGSDTNDGGPAPRSRYVTPSRWCVWTRCVWTRGALPPRLNDRAQHRSCWTGPTGRRYASPGRRPGFGERPKRRRPCAAVPSRHGDATVGVGGGGCGRRCASAAVGVDAWGVAAAVKRSRPTWFLFDRPNGPAVCQPRATPWGWGATQTTA